MRIKGCHGLKRYLDDVTLSTSFRKLKEWFLLEGERSTDEVCGERLECDFEIAHIAVVEATCGLEFVFGVGKFALEFDEVLVCFEVRIRFSKREDFTE